MQSTRNLALLAVLALAVTARADHPAGGPAYNPQVQPASDEGQKAIKSFRVPQGLKVDLYAAEPHVANPVAFGFDEKGRLFVVETFRLHHGVTDTRNHMNWLDDDLACRTVDDRVKMYRKVLGKEAETYGVEHDRIRLVEDTDGDGKADRATVFADGFHDLATGLGAGVLARKGDVYFSCIPDLWLLRDRDGDGKADERRSLHHGYGVHVGFLGHDLHGLTFGPDGRLYFSIGDRGTNVETAERRVFLPDTGAVFRCNPDGSELEVFATGLRNPQELVFDEHGNLFTVDNNSDGGDRARLVHIVEGGDSGWRIGYQFIESPNSRGPWNAEKLWRPEPENTAAYLLPPLANITDGPSGLTYNPGSTLLPERYRGHFFIADFRGSAGQSGVRSFAVKPRGASFEIDDAHEFLWGLEATDCDFGPDGALYVSDWVEGWGTTGKGRIYRVADAEPSERGKLEAEEVRKLLAEGTAHIAQAPGLAGIASTPEERIALRMASHAPDYRVRQELQFALAARGAASIPILSRVAEGTEFKSGKPPMLEPPRLHALWALGQIARNDPKAFAPVVARLADPEAEVRAQAARTLADSPRGWPAGTAAKLIERLRDDQPRVRMYAALALAKSHAKDAVDPVIALIRENDDRDPYLRHAGVMALAALADRETLAKAAKDPSAAARLGALLALRRRESEDVASFLDDSDPRLVLEAARAINDVPIPGAADRLAALATRSDLAEPVWRRVVNANFRLGGAERARALAGLAARADVPEAIRMEAFDALASWAKPSGRDRIVGLWRPLPEREAGQAVAALEPVATTMLDGTSETSIRAAARAVHRLGVPSVAPKLLDLVKNKDLFSSTRIEALKALEGLDAKRLAEAIDVALEAGNSSLRSEGLRLLARADPARAIPALEQVLESGTPREQQSTFATLGEIAVPGADTVLSRWLDRLQEGKVAPEVRLDLREAAARRDATEIKERLTRIESAWPKDDPLARYRDALVGGDAGRGRRIFEEKAEAQCLRCHKINGRGGEVGPDLTGLGRRQPREYLLEAIVDPNRKIAEGFESVMLATTDGQVHAGVLKGEDEKEIRLITPEGRPLTIPKADVEDRKRGASAMPEDTIKNLRLSELRDLVEFLAGSR